VSAPEGFSAEDQGFRGLPSTMSGLFGIFRRDGSPVAGAALETMRAALTHWGRDGSGVRLEGCVGLGQLRSFTTPEACSERLPRAEGGILFTAAGRVDNRDELISDLSSLHPISSPVIPDGDLLLSAYRRWGPGCVSHIYGDWAFAAYHPAERKLFVARDHFGNTSLYYYADPRVFAFASDRRALLALDLAPVEMDDLYLAQVLVSWPAYHGERTIHKPIKRLPPAHYLAVTPERLEVRQYWRLEDTPELRLPRREDYAQQFREVFDEAVRERLRVREGKSDAAREERIEGGRDSAHSLTPIGVSLSGGLDSGSVTATAAKLLRQEGKWLTAFTSVLLSDSSSYVGERFGDELPFAQATAQFAGNVDHVLIRGTTLTPIQAIRSGLQIWEEPGHAAGNLFWGLELRQTAQAHGCRVLLTGQMGNAGSSWTGDPVSQSLAFQLRHLGWRKWTSDSVNRTKERVKSVLPRGLMAARRRRLQDLREWCRESAIHPDLARRLNLPERRWNDPGQGRPVSPREHRCRILMPGRSFGGALHAEMGAAFGLDVRDPTADARVLTFALSVPDSIFIDPATGQDRWLIREAMKDHLPDQVRLNRRRGRQAGDLVPRLRACAGEVDCALDELGRGAAAGYVDVSYLRETWDVIRTQDTPRAYNQAVTILTRGIMAGLFVNQLYQ
jgi:asparagine synthase (glutamine-hydrolysing)